MANTNITIRIDEDLKQRFEAFCDDVGMNVTTAVTMFIKASLRENALPFAVKSDPFYSEANMAHVRKGIEQAERGEYVTMNLDELRAFLGMKDDE